MPKNYQSDSLIGTYRNLISHCPLTSSSYSHARLLEINSHSLFSKWFSESGKLVQRLFTSITDLIDEDDAFIVVLIDEVESLTAARAGAMAGNEPSDGLRVGAYTHFVEVFRG